MRTPFLDTLPAAHVADDRRRYGFCNRCYRNLDRDAAIVERDGVLRAYCPGCVKPAPQAARPAE